MTGGQSMQKETIVVTGAGHGIGRATAELLAARDAALVLADANEERLGTAAEACAKRGAEVLAVPFDQRSRESVDALFARADERFGRIDGLANVVGVYPAQRVTEMSDEFWDNASAPTSPVFSTVVVLRCHACSGRAGKASSMSRRSGPLFPGRGCRPPPPRRGHLNF